MSITLKNLNTIHYIKLTLLLLLVPFSDTKAFTILPNIIIFKHKTKVRCLYFTLRKKIIYIWSSNIGTNLSICIKGHVPD